MSGSHHITRLEPIQAFVESQRALRKQLVCPWLDEPLRHQQIGHARRIRG